MNLLVVFFTDRFRHVEQERGFTRARRRYNQATLAASDWGYDIDHASGVTIGCGFESDALVWVDRSELVKVWKLRCGIGNHVVDRGDFHKLRTTIAFLMFSVKPLTVAK